VLLSSVVGLAFGGVGGAVVGGFLSVLFFGPAYLLQNSIRRRRGGDPAPRSPTEQARSDARVLRAMAFGQVVLAAAFLVAAFVDREGWLPGTGGTAFLVLIAALAITGAPHSWATAELRETQRMLRWAWGLAGALELLFGLTAIGIAVTNQRSSWIGGAKWTATFAAVGLLWLLAGMGDLVRARR
jgi:hypothetical protein